LSNFPQHLQAATLLSPLSIHGIRLQRVRKDPIKRCIRMPAAVHTRVESDTVLPCSKREQREVLRWHNQGVEGKGPTLSSRVPFLCELALRHGPCTFLSLHALLGMLRCSRCIGTSTARGCDCTASCSGWTAINSNSNDYGCPPNLTAEIGGACVKAVG
jgi:hypothetical protein